MKVGTRGKIKGRLVALCLIDINRKRQFTKKGIYTLLLSWYRLAVMNIPMMNEN